MSVIIFNERIHQGNDNDIYDVYKYIHIYIYIYI